jgi:cyanophycin synthetase
MEVLQLRALRGPNIWTKKTALEALVQFDLNLETETLAKQLAHSALELQVAAGCDVHFCTYKPALEANGEITGKWQVVVEYSEEAVGRAAFDSVLQAQGRSAEVVKHLQDMDENLRLGPSTKSIVDAALLRNIPFVRLTEGSLVQLGWGANQRRIQAAESSETSAIAESIAQDKDLTKTLLQSAGVPVPQGRPVSDADDAWLAAQEIGSSVVVKPLDGNQGKGVTVNITSEAQVRTAFDKAKEIRNTVLVERYLPGFDFRILVVGGKMIAAARRDPPTVTGNGIDSVEALVAAVNLDPLRGDGHATPLTRITIDSIASDVLAEQGLSASKIPEKNQRVVLRNNANLSTGGSATDVTDDVHPEVAASAIAAAQMIGLDICGIDIVSETLSKPLEEQGGGVVEVNAAPGLRMHLNPSYGRPRDVGEAIITSMFGEKKAPSKVALKDSARVPLIAVTGTNGKTTTVRLAAHIAQTAGHVIGMTNSDGVYVGGLLSEHRIDTGDCSGPKSARSVLAHPDVDFAVLETARGGVLREGLGFDQAQVAVVTNIGIGDHLGLNFIHDVAGIAKVKQVIVDNVATKAGGGWVVLNAADPLTLAMAENCAGNVLLFASTPLCPALQSHRRRGSRVLTLDPTGQSIIAVEHNQTVASIALSEVPFTKNGALGFQVENALAASAASWCVDLSWDAIRQGLQTFINDAASAPGRFNVFDYKGATLVADYGHNPDAIQALVDAVKALPGNKRSVVVSGAGDRRDEDISEQTRILGKHFDEVILYEDACQRGRQDGEVLALLRKGLDNAERTRNIDEVHGEFKAIDLALGRLQPGDLCLVLVDQVEEAVEYLRSVSAPSVSAPSV